MPNWAEGTLKVRGKKENIVRFLKEGLLGYPEHSLEINEQGTPVPKYSYRKIDLTEDDWETSLKCEGGFYINKTRRAFIEESCIQFYHDNDEEVCQLEILGFKQAWAALPENYVELSKEFGVDFKIFTFEMGMEFTQEIEVTQGCLAKDCCKQGFDDYFWDVAFSSIGG